MKNRLIIAATLFFVLKASAQVTLPADDKDYSCIQRTEADQFVQDFSVDVSSFGGLELCNANIDTKKLFNDFKIIKEGRFSAQGKNNLIRGFLDQNNYYNWMKIQTHGISRGDDIPFATAYNSGGYFTMQDGWAQLSTLGRVGTIVHEARHTEGYYHIQCVSGPYSGSSVAGCDRDYNYGGSHGIEMEYYARVSVVGDNFHPVYKKMARLMAIARTNFVFNKAPMQKKSALVVLDQMGQAYLLNQDLAIKRDTPQLKGNLKRTSYGATLFDGLKAFAIELYENAGIDHNTADDYSYFKMLKQDRGQGRDPLADLEEVDLGQKRYIFFLNNKNKTASYEFSNGKWSPSQEAPAKSTKFITTLADGTEGAFVQTQDGGLYSFRPENMTNFKKINAVLPADFKQFSKANSTLYALNQKGEVLIQSKNDWINFAPLQNQRIEQMVSVPLYDGFDVK